MPTSAVGPNPNEPGRSGAGIDDAEDERGHGRGQRDQRSDDRERPGEAPNHRAQARSANGIPAGPVSDIGASSSVHVTGTLRDCRENEYRYAVTKEPSPPSRHPAARAARGAGGRRPTRRGYPQGRGDPRPAGRRGASVRARRAGGLALARFGRIGGERGPAADAVVAPRGRRARGGPRRSVARCAGSRAGSGGPRGAGAAGRVGFAPVAGRGRRPGARSVPGRLQPARQPGVRRLAGGTGGRGGTDRDDGAGQAGRGRTWRPATCRGRSRRRPIAWTSIPSTKPGTSG